MTDRAIALPEFESWWLASKYCQVVHSDKGVRRAALDAWNAAIAAHSSERTSEHKWLCNLCGKEWWGDWNSSQTECPHIASSEPSKTTPEQIQILRIIDRMHRSAELLFVSKFGCDGEALADAAEELRKIASKPYSESQRVVDKLRDLCGCAYQLAGYHDAPVEWLDALGDAANGVSLDQWRVQANELGDVLLPYPPAAELVSRPVDTNTVVSTGTDNPRHSVEPAPRVDGEEMITIFPGLPALPAWLFEAAEKIEKYMSLHHPGHWIVNGIQRRSTHPEPREVTGANALLKEVCDELEAGDCGACIGSMAPWEDLRGRIELYLTTHPQPSAPVDEYECEVMQDDEVQAVATGPLDHVLKEGAHYAMMYGQDGPVSLRYFAKRELTESEVEALATQRAEG